MTTVSYHGAEWDASEANPFGPVRSTFEEAERPYLYVFEPGDRVIVSGVGFGYTLAALAVRCGRTNVVGIEAQRDLAYFTGINIIIDGHELDVRWQALTPDGRPAVLRPARVWACVAAVPADADDAETVPGVTLTSLRQEGFDCLMLDIEGGEWGLLPELRLFRKVVLELHNQYASPEYDLFTDALRDMGFEVRGSDCTFHEGEPVCLVSAVRED